MEAFPVIDASAEELFEGSVVPSLLIDVGRRQVLAVNEAALRVLGLPAEEVIGRPGADFLSDPTHDEVLRARGLRGDPTLSVRRVATESGPRTMELNLVPTFREGVVFVQAIDLTDALEASLAAEARIESLAKTNGALESIARRLGHDLQSPLAVVLGFAELLRTKSDALDDDQRSMMLERISVSAKALSAMCQSLVDEALGGTSHHASDSREVSVLFAELRDLLGGALDQAGGRLETTSEVAELPVPASALRQAVLNLVSNAINYRSPDRDLRIELAVDAAADGAVITVTDNGRGFGATDPETLFEPGVRGDSSTGTTGTGLGLSFVRTAVENVRGTITAADTGTGARFTIRITDPRIDAPAIERTGFETGLTARQLDALIDASPVPTLVLDLGIRQIVRVNTAAISLIGRPADQIVGRQGSSFLSDPTLGDTLRTRAMANADEAATLRSTIETARGPRAVTIALSVVPDSTIGIAQIVDIESRVIDHAAAPAAASLQALLGAAANRVDDLDIDELRRIVRTAADIANPEATP